jgi:hypothetical protein
VTSGREDVAPHVNGVWFATRPLKENVREPPAAGISVADAHVSPPPVVVVEVHTPELQTWPVAQRMPQPPQFSVSVSVFTHAPEQSVVPAAHTGSQ